MNIAIPLLGIYSKELKAENRTDVCIPKSIAALFTIAKRWKQLKCPSKDEWINKMWCIPKMESHSALKRNEILIHATIWMNLEYIILREISRHKRTNTIWLRYVRYLE